MKKLLPLTLSAMLFGSYSARSVEAAPPTPDQQGYFIGKGNLVFYMLDEKKTYKLKGEVIVELNSDGTGTFTIPDGGNAGSVTFTTQGNYGQYRGCFIGDIGDAGRLDFKGAGSKTSISIVANYVHTGAEFVLEYKGKVKKVPIL